MSTTSPRSLFALLLLAGAGCTEYVVVDFESVDQFNQNPWERVDVLLVVDNSGSMEPYQEKLVRDFGAFFEFFDIGEVDWQIAVVHTDGLDRDMGYIRGPIITPQASDPQALFADVVHVGTEGNGIETGLESARRALSGINPGFPRDDSSLSVIFVSDEQDSSPDAVADYVDGYYALRGPRARDAFNASALTVTEIADCTPEQFLVSSPGTRYIEAAEQTGGITANLCVEDFESIVVDLALTTSAVRDTFYLSHRPAADTLELSIEDEIIPCDDGSWRYELVEEDGIERPAIVFDPLHIPAASDRINVQYTHGNGDPAAFCVPPSDAGGLE